MLERHVFYHGFHDLKTIFFQVLLHCLHTSGYLGHFTIKMCQCSENQLVHSCKSKLKCTCPKSLFSNIHLPGQVPMWRHAVQEKVCLIIPDKFV